MKKTFFHISYLLIFCFCIFTNIVNANPEDDAPIWFDYLEDAWDRPESMEDYFIAAIKINITDDPDGAARQDAWAVIGKKAFVNVKSVYERKRETKSVNGVVEMCDYVIDHTYVGTNILLFDCVPEKIKGYFSHKTGKYYSIWAIKKEKILNAIDLAQKKGWTSPEKSPEVYNLRARGIGTPRKGVTNPDLQKETARKSAKMGARRNLVRLIHGAEITNRQVRDNQNGSIVSDVTIEEFTGILPPSARIIPNTEKWKNGIYTLEMWLPFKDYQAKYGVD